MYRHLDRINVVQQGPKRKRARRGRRMRRALELDRQLGGGVSPIPSKQHWEEECVASMKLNIGDSEKMNIINSASQQ
ncbi:hypothetical protein BJF91_05795 [Allorhizobium taibaishanense]|uniref:Uncharacterized protein n=1 Tax=Allorhizobium taibaishanense TaxID=887144 RepID=A0A1Q9A865_9HYPH|nr:hypothetical protein BJF91_05795 [Allorhizobium taibaishanense]